MTVELEKAQEAKKLPVTDDIREAMALIRRGTDTFLIEEEFEQKLARSKMTGEPLRCKLGLDPAVMASPIITTIVDFLSLLVYFAFATAMLGIG